MRGDAVRFAHGRSIGTNSRDTPQGTFGSLGSGTSPHAPAVAAKNRTATHLLIDACYPWAQARCAYTLACVALRALRMDRWMPQGWLRPLPLTCLAAAWIVLADVHTVLSAFPTRHSIAHQAWNHGLLVSLLVVQVGWVLVRQLYGARDVSDAGLLLAALGLGGRALVEVPLTCMERWPHPALPQHAAPFVIADATRVLGLAAYAVGLTLFAVEVAGWWIDRKAART